MKGYGNQSNSGFRSDHGQFRGGHRIRTGENAINSRMSFDLPPEWGPHRGGYTYTRWVAEVKEWKTITKIAQENQGTALYSQLQGVAKNRVETWLYNNSNTRDRRNLRIQKGNRKHRIQEFNRKLAKQREDQMLRMQAQMETEHMIWGTVRRRAPPVTRTL